MTMSLQTGEPSEAIAASREDSGAAAVETPPPPSPTPRRRSRSKRLLLGGNKRQSLLQLENTITDRTRQLLESLHPSQESLVNALSSSFRASGRRSSFSRNNKKRVTKQEVKELEHDDVEVGKLVGKGGFSHVYELKNVRRKSFLDMIVCDNKDLQGAVGFDDSQRGKDDDGDGSVHSHQSSSSGEVVAKNFVVKHLNAAVRQDRESYHMAAADLAFEAKLLSSISHPNIVCLRGVTRGCEISALYAGGKRREGSNGEACFDGGYFIVLEKLECTLKERIVEWRDKKKSLKRSVGKSFRQSSLAMLRRSSSTVSADANDEQEKQVVNKPPSPARRRRRSSLMLLRRLSSFGTDNPNSSSDDDALDPSSHHSTSTKSAMTAAASSASAAGPGSRRTAKREFLRRRLDAARQIACAMAYMHSKRILYRDLKPENVGFDSATGDVKIFDFGLARFLPKDDNDDPENRKNLTGIAGTPRYMAPEVAKCKKYGLSADVYSFGLLLWEILSLKKPFGDGITHKEMQEKVVYGTRRPKVEPTKWPREVCDLMEMCWDADPDMRPEFGRVLDVLDRELDALAM